MVTSLILFLIALGFRVIDIFVLRLDERWGEILLSKSLGVLMLLAYLRIRKRPFSSLGFHARRMASAVTISAGGTGLLFLLGYGIQMASLKAAGAAPVLVFAAVDPKTGMAGSLGFAAWLVLGNLINSTMEEGLFRGVILPRFMQRFSFVGANLLQALLFASWHLVWPVKHYWTGTTTPGGALAEAAMLFVATFISGYAYGYYYRKTDSLWTPWVAHTINNSVLNLFHIRTAAGLDTDVFVMQAIVVLGLIPMMGFVKWASDRRHMPKLRPWAA